MSNVTHDTLGKLSTIVRLVEELRGYPDMHNKDNDKAICDCEGLDEGRPHGEMCSWSLISSTLHELAYACDVEHPHEVHQIAEELFAVLDERSQRLDNWTKTNRWLAKAFSTRVEP